MSQVRHSDSSVPETTVGRLGVCHFHSCCFSFFRLLLFGQFLCCAQSILLALCPGITSGGTQRALSAARDRIRAERMKGLILLLDHTCWCSRLCSLGSLLERLGKLYEVQEIRPEGVMCQASALTTVPTFWMLQPFFFCLFICLGVTPSSTQELFLALYSEIAPDRLGDHMEYRNLNHCPSN